MIMYLQILQIILLIIILILVILLYMNSINTETYCNCFGSQYNGLSFLDTPNDPICSSNTTKPLYKDGGCSTYNSATVSKDYEKGLLNPKGV